jgi:hypothetical protein
MKTINYSAKNIRIFLLLLTAFSALILWRGFPGVAGQLKMEIAAAIALAALLFGLFPRFFAPAYKVIMTASGFIGNTIFLIIATVVFFAMLTPIALIMRLFGKVFMSPAYDKSAASYFENPQAAQSYEKQY